MRSTPDPLAYVPPSGPVPCDLAVVGEGPWHEEVAQGIPLVGPTGRMLWGKSPEDYNLIGGIVARPRETVYVTNVTKNPCPDEAWQALPEEIQKEYYLQLRDELTPVQPKVVLAFGRRACTGLVPRFHSVTVDSGKPRMGYGPYIVMPIWHPAAFLRGNGKVLNEIVQALVQVPSLLEHGLPAEPEIVVPANHPDSGTKYRTTDEFLDIWPTNIAFLERVGETKQEKCVYCGVTTFANRYHGNGLKWKLCHKHAWALAAWAELEAGKTAMKEQAETVAADSAKVLLAKTAKRLEAQLAKHAR